MVWIKDLPIQLFLPIKFFLPSTNIQHVLNLYLRPLCRPPKEPHPQPTLDGRDANKPNEMLPIYMDFGMVFRWAPNIFYKHFFVFILPFLLYSFFFLLFSFSFNFFSFFLSFFFLSLLYSCFDYRVGLYISFKLFSFE